MKGLESVRAKAPDTFLYTVGRLGGDVGSGRAVFACRDVSCEEDDTEA